MMVRDVSTLSVVVKEGLPEEVMFLSFLCFFNVYLVLRETERKRDLTARKGGAERAGDRESQAGSSLSAQSLMQDSNPQTVRS